MSFFIPAILEKDVDSFFEKLEIMKRVGLKVGHLDVMDGRAVPNECWGDIEVIRDLDMQFEVHLMIENVLAVAEKWSELENVVRVIARGEEIDDMGVFLAAMKKNPKLGIAIDPSADATEIYRNIDRINFLLLMGVESGFSGQEFNPNILQRIRQARLMCPELQIGIDGGMNGETIPMVKELGADVINAASFFWGGDQVKVIELVEKG